MGTSIPVKKGTTHRLLADGVIFYADDKSVALYVTFTEVDLAKIAADAERQEQAKAAGPNLAVVR
jgi:hypothetical protein